VQEYCGGDEISVFYTREPGKTNGEIFSVTEKRFPIVTGDGTSTLEDLILRDDRAVCLAEKYLEQNRDRLGDIPASDIAVKIIDIGTHSRGAVFLDGHHLLTPKLTENIDELACRIDGFFFGRFDLRYSTREDLAAGNFKIIELNGVTSESTNIYDPRYSLLDAYRILFAQWKIAFEIGHANQQRGIRQNSVVDLVRLLLGRGSATQARPA
jgi:hypothetical protein